MDSEYILNLFNQFHKAVGTSTKDWTSQQFIFEFSDWLKEYKKVVKEFALYNEFLGIDLTDPFLAEVGKGKHDTIVSNDATIISPYANTLKKEQSTLIILENTPLIATPGGIIKTDNIKMFLTHNPYNELLIQEWYKIHNLKEQSISIGVYGKIYDKDKAEKLRMMKRLLEKMDEYYETTYDEIGDNYFANVKSSYKILKKELLRK